MDYLDVCGSEKARFCRDGDGNLYQWQAQKWEKYRFNEIYRDYYKPCRFTALGYFGGQFYAAGVDGENRTHLFLSLMGGVWNEQNLVATSPMGGRTELRGAAVKLLYTQSPYQVCLLTNAGQLAILPDCPKCIRILPLEDEPVDGWMDEKDIRIKWRSGGERTISLASVNQFRVAWSYAADLIKKHGATVVDLRSQTEYQKGHIQPSVSIQAGAVEGWLEGQSKEAYLLFLCKYGVQADQCAKFARKNRFVHAYSMGGTEPFAHLD